MNSKISERSKRIGLKVKLERTKRGLSQEKLAELADLSKGSLGAIERGQSSATIETLEKLANAFGMEFNELIDISKFELQKQN